MPPANQLFRRVWGDATALLHRARHIGWVDFLVIIGLVGLLFGFFDLAREWAGHQPASAVKVRPEYLVALAASPQAGFPGSVPWSGLFLSTQQSLNVWDLPRFTFYSLSRGLLAYLISLAFTLAYGYWAAKDANAERLLIPLLDILQSIPVLGFFPILLLALKGIFPGHVGLELVAIVMIFTGQAWNMTFSFYYSLRALPQDQREVATVYRFNLWQRFKWVEVPYSMMGLVWNSMMSMAGGWFFLTVCEQFRLGDEDYRLPGLGSFMSMASDQGRWGAMLWSILAMILMIVALDQLLWRPVVVWAQKFRVEEGGSQAMMSSWFLDWLRRSRLLAAIGGWLRHLSWHRMRPVPLPLPTVKVKEKPVSSHAGTVFSLAALGALMLLLGYGAWKLLALLLQVPGGDWGEILPAGGLTLGRVLLSTALGTLWALPAGLAIGLSPRLSRFFQPIVQVVASFPAPMLFPLVVAALEVFGISFGWASIVLMLLGTQWYILFNVIAGAMAVPADLREAATSYRLNRWYRFRILYLPAVFPHLITGWVTAAGGAWNASIVAEYGTYNGKEFATYGLGSLISEATRDKNFPRLAASILVMAVIVVIFNRSVWRRLYALSEKRFTLDK